MSIRASLNQLIGTVIVTIHQNSHVLNLFQIVTSIDLLKCCKNLAALFLTWAVNWFADRFLRSWVRIEVRPTENDSTRLYKNGDISVVITCSLLNFGR